MGTFHVVGGGMAGLAAALHLSRGGRAVVLYEAARHAGGRCRSFFEPALGCDIDNGNHLLLTGNTGVAAYIRETGAEDRFYVPAEPALPFLDLRTGERWTIRPNLGPVPWWIFCRDRRVPATRPRDYLAALRLRRAAPTDTVEAVLGNEHVLYARFWEPVAVAALNTPAAIASARLLWPVFAETFGRGGRAARSLFARRNLGDALVDPALATLRGRGASIRFGHRLREVGQSENRIERLEFTSGCETIGANDTVVLALPAAQTAALLPDVPTPGRFHAIVNVHYRLDVSEAERRRTPLLGLLGGTAEWLFLRDGIVSVTISAADALAEEDSDTIAARVWPDVSQALGMNGAAPAYRVVKEKRATFSQTPENETRRSDSATRFGNLFLAGDWTNTGLPATIEGAIRSGFRAATLAESR